ncbi:uncharacterized protein [Clytia hemisphaerica]
MKEHLQLVAKYKAKGVQHKVMKYVMMAYNDQNDGRYTSPSSNQDNSTNASWRMSGLINELEGRCKSLEEDNKRLGEMVHKYKTEFEVETSYLKKQVSNEHEKQLKWKNLYYNARSEITELKHQLHQMRPQKLPSKPPPPSSSNAPISCSGAPSSSASLIITTASNELSDLNNNTPIVIPPPHIRRMPPHTSLDSGCKECENERKRTSSESEPTTMAPLHSRYAMLSPTAIGSSSLHPSPKDHHHGSEHHLPMFPSPQTPSYTQPIVGKPPHPLTSPTGSNLYYECRICYRRYDTEQKLHFHQQVHARARPPSIGDYPPEVGPPPSSLGAPNVEYCTECPESFVNDEEYRKHLLVHMFKCRYCNIVLESETEYVVHMKTHSDTIPLYVCYICDKQLGSVQQLTRHILSHPDELNFHCKECNKSFTHRTQLNHHMAVHSSRPYTCKECGKKFAHKTHLRRHEVVHSGLRPHKCRVCNQSFSRKSSLSRHYFIHTTEKPFVCPICEKGFNRKGRLKNHLNIHIREGYSQLKDYVIERRPITREFIEQMNQVKSDDPVHDDMPGYTTMTDLHQRAPSFVVKSEPHEYEMKEHSANYTKGDESEESSCSDTDEGEIDENEADMSEEITFDHQAPSDARQPPRSATLPPHAAEAEDLDRERMESAHRPRKRTYSDHTIHEGVRAFDHAHPRPHSRESLPTMERGAAQESSRSRDLRSPNA